VLVDLIFRTPTCGGDEYPLGLSSSTPPAVPFLEAPGRSPRHTAGGTRLGLPAGSLPRPDHGVVSHSSTGIQLPRSTGRRKHGKPAHTGRGPRPLNYLRAPRHRPVSGPWSQGFRDSGVSMLHIRGGSLARRSGCAPSQGQSASLDQPLASASLQRVIGLHVEFGSAARRPRASIARACLVHLNPGPAQVLTVVSTPDQAMDDPKKSNTSARSSTPGVS
jgi:hypothetical protein